MKIKNILRIVCVIIILLLIVGCGYTREELKLKDLYIKQGKENAVKYIKDKYGFEATIDDTIALTYNPAPSLSLFPSFNGDVLVNMSYNNKKFEVQINGDDESIDGFDNYQEDLIKDSFIEIVSEEFGLIPTQYDISYGRFYKKKDSDCLIKEYYDGTNLFEILNERLANIRLNYYGHNLRDYTNSSLFSSKLSNTDIIIINFRTIDDLNMLREESMASYLLYMFAFNISDAVTFDGNGMKYYSFDLKRYDDFYYVAIGDSDVVINKCETASINMFTSNSKYEKISNSYCINGSYDVIYLYYPLDKVKNRKYSANSYSLVYQFYDKGQMKYSTPSHSSYINNKYISESIYKNEFKFVVVGKVK